MDMYTLLFGSLCDGVTYFLIMTSITFFFNAVRVVVNAPMFIFIICFSHQLIWVRSGPSTIRWCAVSGFPCYLCRVYRLASSESIGNRPLQGSTPDISLQGPYKYTHEYKVRWEGQWGCKFHWESLLDCSSPVRNGTFPSIHKSSQVRAARQPYRRHSHLTGEDAPCIQCSVDILVQKLFPVHRPGFPTDCLVLNGFQLLCGDPPAGEALQKRPGLSITITEGRITHTNLGPGKWQSTLVCHLPVVCGEQGSVRSMLNGNTWSVPK